jgi:hypothetical protein
LELEELEQQQTQLPEFQEVIQYLAQLPLLEVGVEEQEVVEFILD